MRIEQLKYFIEIVNCQNISAAAEKLYLQQSTLSHALKSLESEIGLPLLTRKNNGVYLNKDGEYLFPIIKRMLNDYNCLINYKANNTQKNEISIAVSPQLTNLFCQFIYQPLKEVFQNIQIHIHEEFPPTFSQGFRKHLFDIAFACCKQSSIPEKKQLARIDDLQFVEMFSTPTSAVFNSKHVLAKEEALHIDILRDYPQLLTDGIIRPGLILSDSYKETQKDSRKLDTFPNFQAIFNVLCTNLSAYSLLPTITTLNEPLFLNGILTERPLIGDENMNFVAYVLYNKTDSQFINKIVNTCVQFFSQLNNNLLND